MSEPFRERQPETQETAPEAIQPIELVSDALSGNETKLRDPESKEEGKLEIWEGLNRKKFINEYFNTHNTADDFMIKMPTSEIDKFVRSELEKLGYEKTTENYKKILSDLEAEIGSDRLELLKRFQKITGYIRAISKLYQAKALKEGYLVPRE
jgi:hypothetical protein